MRETDCNSRLVKTLRFLGWHAHKIPDNGNGHMTKRPYDIFAAGPSGHNLAIEGKMIHPEGRQSYCAFNFGSFEVQQLDELIDVEKTSPNWSGLVALYSQRKNKDPQVTFIRATYIKKLIGEGHKSILGKELADRLWLPCMNKMFCFPEGYLG
jgi:hypothetical protein